MTGTWFKAANCSANALFPDPRLPIMTVRYVSASSIHYYIRSPDQIRCRTTSRTIGLYSLLSNISSKIEIEPETTPLDQAEPSP
jgi:hypothetical protein